MKLIDRINSSLVDVLLRECSFRVEEIIVTTVGILEVAVQNFEEGEDTTVMVEHHIAEEVLSQVEISQEEISPKVAFIQEQVLEELPIHLVVTIVTRTMVRVNNLEVDFHLLEELIHISQFMVKVAITSILAYAFQLIKSNMELDIRKK